MILLVLLAHLWYPPECCHEIHCRPVPCDQIKHVGNEFIFNGMSFSGSMVRQSQDTQCHACFGPVPYCIFLRPEA